MKCNEGNEQLYRYIDGEMEPNEAESFAIHLDECGECSAAYEETIKIKEELKQYAQQMPKPKIDMEQIFLSAEKRGKNDKEEKSQVRKKILFVFKKSVSYAAVFVLGVGLYAVGSGVFGGSKSMGMNYRNSYGTSDGVQMQQSVESENLKNAQDAAASANSTGAKPSKAMPEGLKLSSDKIIYTGNMVIEVEKYEDARQSIALIVEENQGFVQSEEVDISEKGGYEYYTSFYKIRVPVSQYQTVTEKLSQIGTVKYSVQQASNVSYEYYDIQGDIEQLNIQKQRLLNLYQQANTIAELIEIENELTRLNTKINDYENILLNYDREVEYSTIELSISEVISKNALINPFDNLGKRIKEAFVNSINGLTTALTVVFLVIIKILPFALVAGVVFFLVRQIVRKRRIKKE